MAKAKKKAKVVKKSNSVKLNKKTALAKSRAKVKKAHNKTAKKAAKKISKKAQAPKMKKLKSTKANKSSQGLSTLTKKVKSLVAWVDFITPLDDRVLVQMENQERKTAGGLIIPDTATLSGNFEGRVVVVGRGHRDDKGRVRPLDVKVGDRVLFGEYSGTTLNLQGEDLKLLRESELLAVREHRK